MSTKRKQYNPKAHLRALNRKQGELGRIAPAVRVVDTNMDYWIELPAEATSAGDLIIYRYSWEMERQPVAGVLFDLHAHSRKIDEITLIVKLLDRPGIEYHCEFRVIYKVAWPVTQTGYSPAQLVFIPMEYFETNYRYTRGGK